MDITKKYEKITHKSNLLEKVGKIKMFSIMGILVFLLIAAIIISICTGRYAIPVSQMVDIMLGKVFGFEKTWPDTVETVLFSVRMPRIIVSIFVGAALSMAGAVYQGLFKNPMVSPDILGASAGSGFGAALAILLSFTGMEVQISAFIFGILAVGLSYFLSMIVGRKNNAILILVLTGMVVQSLFSAFTSITKYVADPDNKLPAITFWLMGGLNSATWKDVLVMIGPILITTIPLFLIRYKINVLSFGEEEAQAMGIDTKKIRLIIIFCATLLTASSVAVAGMIGWIGLIIPHIARLIVGPNYKILLPTSLLIGATFMILVDDVARSLFTIEIPLGILTAIIGAPFFIYLLLKGKGRAE
ncbi:iron ABC transporter permease [Clostridium sp. BL-8]|uniref:FecCD family ABC transporter permease n=1 Tax=Clostridium sp. BL-8 TaxID=349938 RepID=UPI00098CD034|nr:iron ABC transporter permease [Clostridium sp. BL-8]OOM79529.1 putative ABC transporter permease protein [Clostridium sp. BL-8]